MSRTVNADGNLEHELDGELDDAVIGTRIRSGDRLFSIREILAGDTYILDPQRPLAINDTLEGSDTIRVTANSTTGPELSTSLDFAGPNWRESLSNGTIDGSQNLRTAWRLARGPKGHCHPFPPARSRKSDGLRSSSARARGCGPARSRT